MMENRLIANLQDGLTRAGIDASIKREWSRPVIVTDEAEVGSATTLATETFGVVSASPARRVSRDRDTIVGAIAELATATYEGGTFAVRARRADKDVPYTSADIEHAAGEAVFEVVGDTFEAEVDLDDPDITFHVEVRRDHAYVFTDVIGGPGGLPVGTQEAMVALISGGIDSPVAAYRAMRRGSPVVPVYIDLGQYGGPDHQARALEAIARLHDFAGTQRRPVYIIPGGEAVTRIVDEVEGGRMLVLRRFMFRVADSVASDLDAVGIVTGEALGQKSSQTATNLMATSVVTERPIHRPLLTMDKQQITNIAREIGTYRSATMPAGCPTLAPEQVKTRASPTTVDNLEPADIEELVARAVDGAEVIDPADVEDYGTLATEP